MFCHNCGSQVAADAQFCPQCGTAFGSPLPSLAGSPPVQWTPPATVNVRTGHWVNEGWRLVTSDLMAYVLMGLVFLILSSAVPIVLQGPMIVGLHIFTMKKLLGRRADIGDMFKGFNFFVPALVASVLISVFVGVGMLFCIIPGLVLAAMYKFTYLFIVDKRMDFWQAMQASHSIVKRDYVGFTLFLIVLGLIDLLGLLCFIVGLFVALPVTFAAITVAYHELVGFDPRTVDSL